MVRSDRPARPAGSSCDRAPRARLPRPRHDSGPRRDAWRRCVTTRFRERHDEIGTIEEGKQADLLVVRGDLTGSIEPLKRRANLTLILQGGRPAPRLEGVLRA
jgi:cytosine/adenosine deaminase-related metal-dependent hydrolase